MAIVLLTVALPLTFLPSCNKDKKEMVVIDFNPETSYTLRQTDVETFIYDSGVVRNKIITPLFLMFSRAADPYWFFPEGVYVEQFDRNFNKELSVVADTAWFYERRELWEAKGNVDMTSQEGQRFETSHLFWDRKNETIYSDSFIRITKGETVNTGYGFHSNQNLTDYEIRHASAEIPVEMQRHNNADNTLPSDTIDIEN